VSGFVRDVLLALGLCGVFFVFFAVTGRVMPAGTWFPESGKPGGEDGE
jgi:hypothetical protein